MFIRNLVEVLYISATALSIPWSMADKKFLSVIVKETGPWQNAMEMRTLGNGPG